MRLIDADALLKMVNKYQFGAIRNEYEREVVKENIVGFIESEPTAYDVEAVVEELEKRANDNDRAADRLSGIESKKKIASWRARAQAFRDSTEIVRGKE